MAKTNQKNKPVEVVVVKKHHVKKVKANPSIKLKAAMKVLGGHAGEDSKLNSLLVLEFTNKGIMGFIHQLFAKRHSVDERLHALSQAKWEEVKQDVVRLLEKAYFTKEEISIPGDGDRKERKELVLKRTNSANRRPTVEEILPYTFIKANSELVNVLLKKYESLIIKSLIHHFVRYVRNGVDISICCNDIIEDIKKAYVLAGEKHIDLNSYEKIADKSIAALAIEFKRNRFNATNVGLLICLFSILPDVFKYAPNQEALNELFATIGFKVKKPCTSISKVNKESSVVVGVSINARLHLKRLMKSADVDSSWVNVTDNLDNSGLKRCIEHIEEHGANNVFYQLLADLTAS